MNSHADTNITPAEIVENEVDSEIEDYDLGDRKWFDTAFLFYVRPLEGENAKDNSVFKAERNQALAQLKEYIASRFDDEMPIHAEELAYLEFDRKVGEFKEFTEKNPNVLTEFGVVYENAFNRTDSPAGNIVLAQSKNGEITYNKKYSIDDSLSDKGVITEFSVDKLKEVLADYKELADRTVIEQSQEYSEPMKRAMQLINEYCEAEFEGEADFSDLSKVDIAYTTDAETEVPIQVYVDLEKFRLVKEYDGKIASEEKFDSLDDLSDKVLSNLEFDELVAFYFDVPAEQQIGQEQAEKPDVIKDVGMEDVEAQNAPPGQTIRENRDEFISRAAPEAQHFKVEAGRESAAARKAEILETSAQHQDKFISSAENPSKLLPLLNAAKEFHSMRLKTLNQKNAVRSDRIGRNEAKIEKLTAKVDKLKAANEMLASVFSTKSAPIRAIIKRNNVRIERIRDEKIPIRNAKINEHLAQISLNNRKIEKTECRVDKLESLSMAIGSFGISDKQERRQQFSQAMNGLRDASARSVKIKIEKCNEKIAALSEKYQTASIPDRLDIADKLKNQIAKKEGLNAKLTILAAHAKAFEKQSEAAVDNAVKTVEAKCADYEKALTTGEEAPKLDEFAEEVSVSACKSLDDLQKAVEEAHDNTAESKEAAAKEAVKPDTSLDENKSPVKPTAEKPQKKPSVLGSIKEIQNQQKAEQQNNPPEKSQQKSKQQQEEL